MLSFYEADSVAASPTAPVDPRLQLILEAHVEDWQKSDLLGLTHLLIIQPGDTLKAVVDEVAFSPLINPLDGAQFGSRAFQPFWDWLHDHDGWFELIMTVGNDGFAFVLFIQHSEGVDPDLLALCRRYSR